MKVVFVTPRFAVVDAMGGEVSVGLLVDALLAAKHEVKVVAGKVDGDPPMAEEIPLTAPNIARAARGADVVHAYNMDAIVETLQGARRAGAAAVATANSYWATCLWADMDFPDGERCDGCTLAGIRRDYRTRNPLTVGRKVPALLARAAVRRRTAFLDRYDRVIALTPSSKERLVLGDVRESLIDVVPNMADPAWRSVSRNDTGPGRAGWLFVGALKHTKGPHVAIEALPHSPGARLTLVGDGPEREALETLATRLGVAERVTFAGRLDTRGLSGEYSRASTLVFPVLWDEPFGRVVLEAWAHGLPVVASARGGPGDVIEDGESGLLVPPSDAKALADAAKRAEGERARLAAGGRKALDSYWPERIVPRIVEVYERARKAHG